MKIRELSLIGLSIFLVILIISFFESKKNTRELESIVKGIGNNKCIIKGKIEEVVIVLKNSWYFTYNFKCDSLVVNDTSYFERSLSLKEGLTPTKMKSNSTLLILCSKRNPKLNIPILRKSWVKDYNLQVPDSLMNYIPY